MNSSQSYSYNLKILLVGDSDVGKHEILNYINGNVEDNLYGVISKTSFFDLDGKKVKVQLWDTSGQGRFSTIIRTYSRGAHGIILVFDITNKWSFKGIDRWLQEIDKDIPGVPKILIGNRLHLEYMRQVSEETANQYAKRHGMEYFEISPLCDFNVEDSFKELIILALQGIGIRRNWANLKVKTLREVCFIQLMKQIHFCQLNRLVMPVNLKEQLKLYYIANHRRKNELRSLPRDFKGSSTKLNGRPNNNHQAHHHNHTFSFDSLNCHSQHLCNISNNNVNKSNNNSSTIKKSKRWLSKNVPPFFKWKTNYQQQRRRSSGQQQLFTIPSLTPLIKPPAPCSRSSNNVSGHDVMNPTRTSSDEIKSEPPEIGPPKLIASNFSTRLNVTNNNNTIAYYHSNSLLTNNKSSILSKNFKSFFDRYIALKIFTFPSSSDMKLTNLLKNMKTKF